MIYTSCLAWFKHYLYLTRWWPDIISLFINRISTVPTVPMTIQHSNMSRCITSVKWKFQFKIQLIPLIIFWKLRSSYLHWKERKQIMDNFICMLPVLKEEDKILNIIDILLLNWRPDRQRQILSLSLYLCSAHRTVGKL